MCRYFNNRIVNSSSDINQMPSEGPGLSDAEDVQRERMAEARTSLPKEGRYFTEVQAGQMAAAIEREGQVHMAEEVHDEVVIIESTSPVHLYELCHGFVTADGSAGASEIPVPVAAYVTAAEGVAVPETTALDISGAATPQSDTVVSTASLPSVPQYSADNIFVRLRSLGADI
ncbi:hypothetical protein CYMTET_8582 [Cymbomonas tetramitiformis]|uniref:Uncharacterized protein n=1 Tax=Cymbomonas tetramitiformis TaxID=36881 RepID=A0AAE0GT84_9CHLO|nr:hypothetical protein CYMTET_8582 [Cymbomonas tetramitiformis]